METIARNSGKFTAVKEMSTAKELMLDIQKYIDDEF